MKQLIKLHIGLFKYLRKELPKQKNLKKLIEFLKQIIGVYLRELLKLYKNLFLELDPEFKKQRKQYTHQMQLKKDLQKCLKMLQYLDTKMSKMGKSRTERRQFWRDFYKSAQVRTDVFTELEKELK
jgi:hypothetical protein